MQRSVVFSFLRSIRPAGLAGAALAMILAAALTGPAGAQQAGGYRIQPGDSIRLAVIGVPEFDADITIDIDGDAAMPQIGRVAAAGRTIAEIEADVRQRMSGLASKRYSADGAPVFIPLSGSDMMLSIIGYRPVVVGGDVRRPGEVPFRPGMTVRAALAVAGGASTVAAIGVSPDDAARLAPRLQADFRSLAYVNAALVARLWRIEAALAGEPDRAPPVGAVPVERSVFEDMIASQKKLLIADIERLASEKAFLTRAIEETDQRRNVLERQTVKQQEMVAADEEEFTTVRAALRRGVIQINRVQESRRDLNLSSTRLLETENNLSRVQIERTNFERQLAALDGVRRDRLLLERNEAGDELLQNTARLIAAREQLEINGLTPIAAASTGETEPVIVIYRREGDVQTPIASDLDARVMPGDMIDVRLVTDSPTLTP